MLANLHTARSLRTARQRGQWRPGIFLANRYNNPINKQKPSFFRDLESDSWKLELLACRMSARARCLTR